MNLGKESTPRMGKFKISSADLNYNNNQNESKLLPVPRQSLAKPTTLSRTDFQCNMGFVLSLTMFSTSFKQKEEQQLWCGHFILTLGKSLTGQTDFM